MLTVHTSNRLEVLADALAGCMRGRVGGRVGAALVPEVVVVQSLGMRRWLNFALAERMGVAMNVRFPFPAAFVTHLLGDLLPEEKPALRYERGVLTWRVLAVLPALLGRPEFARLRGYVQGEQAEVRRFELAGEIAAAFDRYLAYRPDWIRAWQRGEGDSWQAILWRAVASGAEGLHPPALAARALEHLRAGELFGQTLPRRFHLFGLSSLAPFYFDFFAEVAKHTEGHLFLLSPTEQYWGDLRSERELARTARKKGKAAIAHAEVGHPLLASLGRVARDFFDSAVDAQGAVTQEYFEEPPAETLLGRVQNDIFHLRNPRLEALLEMAAEDASIQLHNAHSPLRELEILYDQLLALFDRLPNLEPREILVGMPDVTVYAPLIGAVFGSPEDEAARLPYSIADRAAGAESPVVAAFLELLALAGGRLPSNAVLRLLDYAPVRKRFGLAEQDLPLIRDWIVRTGIRWGVDAAQREALGLPAFAENSWRTGLDRLLLGVALPGDGATLFDGLLPEGGIEGSLAETLGGFVEFANLLFRHGAVLEAARTPAEWTRVLREALLAFISGEDEFAEAWREVSKVLEELTKACAAAGLTEALPLGVVRNHLLGALAETDRRAGGFLGGGITFCSLKPMRSIPHRVICLLGMNGDAYPRREDRPAFVLAEEKPRRGDRTQREDDRGLFLEALLSARDVFYLSYVGLSARNSGTAPPSTVIAELLSTLDATATLGGVKPSEAIVRTHRLQAFSTAYYGGGLFSYSQENAAACAARYAQRVESGPFADGALPAAAAVEELPLGTLVRFARHPVRFFAEQRLGVRLPRSAELPGESEPFALDALGKYGLTDELLADELLGEKIAGTASDAAVRQARGDLPVAYAGREAFRAAEKMAGEIVERVRGARFTGPGMSLPVELQVSGGKLVGDLPGIFPQGLLRVRAGSLRGRDLLAGWVEYLALCALAPAGVTPKLTLISKDEKVVEFPPVTDPRPLLADWFEAYTIGQTEPLRLFPDVAVEFARRRWAKTMARKDPFDWAHERWDEREICGAHDEWHVLAFRHDERVLDNRWEYWVERLVRPLIAHLHPEAAASESNGKGAVQ